MNPVGLAFLAIAATCLVVVPRRFAPVPLLACACYMTLAQAVDLGPVSLPVVRLLIIVGMARVAIRRERLMGGLSRTDSLMLGFSAVPLVAAQFHEDPWDQTIFAAGLALNASGTYLLSRIWIRNTNDARRVIGSLAVIMAPLAGSMVWEVISGHNFFSLLGGVHETSDVRGGRVRAQGPFAHAILAGSVGAVCAPMFGCLWSSARLFSTLGLVSSLLMVVASASSGPIVSVAAGLAGLSMWRYRSVMRTVRWLALAGYVGLELAMNAPAYYLLARIDLTGGSTGFHRAALIETAVAHLGEWWLWGTDYTRHWMVTGVSWSQDHADVTNHYIKLGIIGGLPMVASFTCLLASAFGNAGRVANGPGVSVQDQYLAWSLGCALFANVVACIGVSYFDQSVVFLYLTLAVLGSIGAATAAQRSAARINVPRRPSAGAGYAVSGRLATRHSRGR